MKTCYITDHGQTQQNRVHYLFDVALAWPAVVHLLVSSALAHSRIGHEYSSLFIVVINLILMFSL